MKRLVFFSLLATALAGRSAWGGNWYEDSFYLLHEDHHTQEQFEVGRDADPNETAALVALSKPDVIQIHAKGNPGWTTYPTKIGHTPPRLARDVLALWRDMARRDGYPFSAYYNIGRDGEIMKRRPQWNRSQADGKPWDRALCYHSGVAEQYLWPMVREIIEGYRPDGFWFDGSCFTVRVCYCDQCRRRFKREHDLEAPKGADEPGWQAYQEMQRQIYREFVRDTAAWIHKIHPDCLVAVNWAYSLRMPEKPDAGIAYLTGDIGNRVEKLSAEAHWYDSQGLPFDLMTQVSTLYRGRKTAKGRTPGRMAPKPAEQIRQEMAIIIANGGRFFAWDNPTPQSGLVAERLEFLGEVVAPFLRQRQPWCLGWQRVPDVSLLHSAAAHYAAGDKSTVCFEKNDNRIDGAADVLPRLHLNYEMIPDWRLRERDVRSGLLIVEHPKRLTAQTVAHLIEYVDRGGTLLMTGMGIGADQRLKEVFGIADFVGAKGPEPLIVEISGTSTRFEHWLFRLRCSTAAELIGVEDAAGRTYPMLTKNQFGRGLAFYVPVPLLSQHGQNVVPRSLLESVSSAVLPSDKRLVATNAPETVEVVLRRKGSRYALHLVNMATGNREVVAGGTRSYPQITDIPPVPECHISVRLPAKPATVHLQPQGVPLDGWRWENGRLEADVPGFEIHQMVVMEVGQ